MGRYVIIIFGVIILAGAAMSGLLSNLQSGNEEAFPAPACYDFEPETSLKSEVLNGVTFKLIKENAWVPKAKFENEMILVGNSPSGREIYQLEKARNKFKDDVAKEDLLYLRKSELEVPDEVKKGRSVVSSFFFDIYFRAGIPLPDYIKNCKTVGGEIAVAGVDPQSFPPHGFNSNQIVNASRTLVEPAWLYVNFKDTFATIQEYTDPVAERIGTIQTSKGVKELYYHLGTIYLIDDQDAYNYEQTAELIDWSQYDKKSLQMRKFEFIRAQAYSWWTPVCKPAIYLYPEKKTTVHVQVFPKGFLTVTIPEYPKGGWNVTVYPDGKIIDQGKTYPYLYYESKIRDNVVVRPTKGFVVSFDKLPELFSTILPRLGLDSTQTFDFKDYWEKALPKSPYYFVGIMDQKHVDFIEPLIITPSPQTNIRVRLYFQQLDTKITVEEPTIVTPQKNGFTMVEWGGMVKTDKNHPFTCSQ